MLRLVLCSFLVACAGLAGCASEPFPKYTPLRRELGSARAASPSSVDDPEIRAAGRAVLSFDGTEAVLTLYLKLRSPNSLRVAGVSDLGSTTFDVVWTGESAEVIADAAGLGDEWLRDHLILDLAAGMLRPPAIERELVRLEDGRTASLVRRGGDSILEVPFDAAVETTTYRGVDGDLLATIRSRRLAAAKGSALRHLDVENDEAGYRLSLEIVAWQEDAAVGDSTTTQGPKP